MALTATDILAQDEAALRTHLAHQRRITLLNAAQVDRQRAYVRLWGGVFGAALVWLLLALLLRLGWLGFAPFVVLTGLLFGAALVWALFRYADIRSRNPSNFSELLQPNLPSPSSTSAASSASATASGDLSSTTATCTSSGCCASGTTWSATQGKCVVASGTATKTTST